MKSIGSVAACFLLLAVSATAPAAAQTAEESTVADPVASETAAGPAESESGALHRLKGGVGSDLLPPASIRRPKFSPARSIAQGEAAVPMLAQQDRRGGLTWLIVGGSMLGAGLLIDGDAGTALSVGGALVGGYGVYLLVRD